MIGAHLARVWRRHLALQLTSLSVLTAVLVGLNAIHLSYRALGATVERWGRDLAMTVYLRDGAGPEARETLAETARASHLFRDIRFTSKAEATREFFDTLGGEARTFRDDPTWESPLPASYEFSLSDAIPENRRVQALVDWSARLRKLEIVADVVYGQGWVERFSDVVTGLRGGALGLWLLALGTGFLIVANCIRLSISQRREEIEILELVGATRAFILKPFLVEGLVLGLGASLLSIALSFALQTWLLDVGREYFGLWLNGLPLVPLTASAIALNLTSGIGFGVVGAWTAAASA